jgi:diamine N-acetyltransferase
MGIEVDGSIVGHVMWAYDELDRSHWIGGFIIAGEEQGKGYGRAAMGEMITWLHDEQGAETIKLSYNPTNEAAAGLYGRLGFRPTGEMEGEELVVALGVQI